jgi:hypothetical protein
MYFYNYFFFREVGFVELESGTNGVSNFEVSENSVSHFFSQNTTFCIFISSEIGVDLLDARVISKRVFSRVISPILARFFSRSQYKKS